MVRARETLVYHFTHIDNLPSILAAGALIADADVAATALTVDVGNPGIKANRRRRPVDIGPGGVVADYVPFYFAPRSPMMFRIACDHRDGVEGCYPGGDDPLVYAVSSVERISAAGVSWLATDGNAAVALSHFTDDATRLPAFIDWSLMTGTFWADTTDDPDRQRRRMAELLVHRRLPLTALIGYAVRTEARERDIRRILTAAGRAEDYVSVRADWYYGYRRRG